MCLSLHRDFISSSLISLLLTSFNLIVLIGSESIFLQQSVFMLIFFIYLIQFRVVFYRIDSLSFIFIFLLIFSIVLSLIFNIESYLSFFALLNFICFSYFLSVYAKYKSEVFIKALKKYCILNSGILLIFLINSGLNFDSRSLVDGVQPNYIGLMALTCSLSALLFRKELLKYILLTFLLFISFIVSSRTSMLCIILIYLLILFFKIKSNKHSIILFFTIMPIIIFYFYQNIFLFLTDIFMLNDDHRGAGTGFSGRSDRWESAFNYIEKKPILGYGFKNGESLLGFTTDNGYISLLLELGIIGLSVYLFMLALSFLNSLINLKKDNSVISQFCFVVLFIFSIYMFFEQRYINFGNSLSFIVFFCIFYIFSLEKVESVLNKNI